MKQNNIFVSASIKQKEYKKLRILAKQERHTISDQLYILVEFYEKLKVVHN